MQTTNPLWLILILGGFAVGIGVGMFLTSNRNSSYPNISDEGVACTQEAKICSDGSAVGRSGPRCEFTACPGE